LNANNFSQLRPACDKLNQAWHEVSANLYRTVGEPKAQSATTESGAKSSSDNNKKDETVIDAEVVDDDKK